MSSIEYVGNLFFKFVEDGEHEPGEPKDEIEMKKFQRNNLTLYLTLLKKKKEPKPQS